MEIIFAGDTVEFSPWTADSVDTFDVSCFTVCAGDSNPANDTMTGSVVVWPPTAIEELSGIPTALVTTAPVTTGAPFV